jgi:hypothetical protein
MAANACWSQGDELPRDPELGPGGSTGASGSAGQARLTGASEFHVCNAPEPLSGGWERCANGLFHRPERGDCPAFLPRAQGIDLAELQRRYQISSVECQRDGDCTAAPHGYCEVAFQDVAQVQLECRYGCVAIQNVL